VVVGGPGSPVTTPTLAAAPAATLPPTFRLVATAGILSGRTFSIGPKEATIGRDPGTCQVVIADDEISRQHAWVGLDAQGQMVLRDNRSVNGSYVNKERVQERPLKTTDMILLGGNHRHQFKVEKVRRARLVRPRPFLLPRPGWRWTALTQAQELQKRMEALNASADGIDAKLKKVQDDFVVRRSAELPRIMDNFVRSRTPKVQEIAEREMKQRGATLPSPRRPGRTYRLFTSMRNSCSPAKNSSPSASSISPLSRR
jgi:pSer/pThr/pTyr-binding forkhead associated (FHA) protein